MHPDYHGFQCFTFSALSLNKVAPFFLCKVSFPQFFLCFFYCLSACSVSTNFIRFKWQLGFMQLDKGCLYSRLIHSWETERRKLRSQRCVLCFLNCACPLSSSISLLAFQKKLDHSGIYLLIPLAAGVSKVAMACYSEPWAWPQSTLQ